MEGASLSWSRAFEVTEVKQKSRNTYITDTHNDVQLGVNPEQNSQSLNIISHSNLEKAIQRSIIFMKNKSCPVITSQSTQHLKKEYDLPKINNAHSIKSNIYQNDYKQENIQRIRKLTKISKQLLEKNIKMKEYEKTKQKQCEQKKDKSNDSQLSSQLSNKLSQILDERPSIQKKQSRSQIENELVNESWQRAQFKQLCEFYKRIRQTLLGIQSQQFDYLKNKIANAIKIMRNPAIVAQIYAGKSFIGKQIDRLIQNNKGILHDMNVLKVLLKRYLTESKASRFLNLKKNIRRKKEGLNELAIQVGTKISMIQNSKTKEHVINSIKKMSTECLAERLIYDQWNQRAIRKLKQTKIKCDLLKEQIRLHK